MKIIAQTYVAICTKFWMKEKKILRTETLNIAGQPILNSLLWICLQTDVHDGSQQQQMSLISPLYGPGLIQILLFDVVVFASRPAILLRKRPLKDLPLRGI